MRSLNLPNLDLGSVQDGPQPRVVQGLGQEILGSLFDGVHRNVHARVSGDEDDGPMGILGFELCKELESRDFWHDYIGDHDIRDVPGYEPSSGFCGVSRLDSKSPILKSHPENFQHGRLIIYHQDPCGSGVPVS